MTASKLLSAISIALLAAAGAAHAETYNGVHPLTNGVSRTEISSQAVVAAHSANPYAEGANNGVAPIVAGAVDRATVRAAARAAARGDVLPL